jgi:hypothetical protein
MRYLTLVRQKEYLHHINITVVPLFDINEVRYL